MADVHRARHAGDRVRRGDRAGATSRGGRGDARRAGRSSHGLKWIDYRDVPEAEERAHLAEAIRIHTAATGERPLGWYTGRGSVNTLKAVLDEGGFLYSSDLLRRRPSLLGQRAEGPHLIVPYTLDANDMRFINPQGFASGEAFFGYLKDAFDVLYAEGGEAPKMMSVGLHCRLVGRPGRAAALARFLDYVAARAGLDCEPARHRAALASDHQGARRAPIGQEAG